MKRPPEHVKVERPSPVAAREVRGVDEPRLIRWLLGESLRRLRAARALETSRKIVYPETTCIVRDCERLARRLNEYARAKVKAEEPQPGGAVATFKDGTAEEFDVVPAFADDLEVS